MDVPVQLTLLNSKQTVSDGKAMAEALAKIAESTAATSYGDPSQWQRDTRQDRILHGREE